MVDWLIDVLPHGQENVATDEFVNAFDVRTRADKPNPFSLTIDDHLFCFPIHVPRAHHTVPPTVQYFTTRRVYLGDLIVCNAKNFLGKQKRKYSLFLVAVN